MRCHPEDKVGFLSREMLIFLWYYYWNRWNVWVSNSVLFGRYFVPIASLKALDHWRVLDCTRLGLCQSCSLLYNHLLEDDKSMGGIVCLFLKRVNECFWYLCMTFILAFLILWLKVLPLVLRHPKLKLMHLVPGNHEALWKRMQISQHKCILYASRNGAIPFQYAVKNEKMKISCFPLFWKFHSVLCKNWCSPGSYESQGGKTQSLACVPLSSPETYTCKSKYKHNGAYLRNYSIL